MDLKKRIEILEKKVAELEGRVQEQPGNNFNTITNLMNGANKTNSELIVKIGDEVIARKNVFEQLPQHLKN